MKNILLFLTCLLFACSRYSGEVEMALKQAGDNRAELEKVLVHYSSHPADSLKYRAACFLIENMPCHKHFTNDKISAIIREIYTISVQNNILAAIAVDSVENKYGKLAHLTYEEKLDVKTVTSDYLIKNIDFAFKAWKEAPWSDEISFDQFCNEILPYKIAVEPIDDWREQYYNTFKPVLDSLQEDNSYFTACQLIYDALMEKEWQFTGKIQVPGVSANTLLENRVGNCMEQSSLVVYAMRSLAIPAGIDKIIQNPIRANAGHSWNYIKDKNGNIVEFLLEKPWRPTPGLKDSIRLKGIVYRVNFKKQSTSLPVLYPDESIPPALQDPFLKNVSAEYFPKSNIDITTNKDVPGKLLYLCSFNNQEWIPIAGAPATNGKVNFTGVEPNIVYIGATYYANEVIPVTDPFILKKDNTLHFLIPDTVNLLKKMSLKRKFPLSSTLISYKKRMINGRFQIADQSDFSPNKTLYKITKEIDLQWQIIALDKKHEGQYVRYLSGKNGYCNMAEIKFFSNGKELKGKIIGTDAYVPNDRFVRDKTSVFDNDPLTFFDASQSDNSWVGLNFGQTVLIDKIEFLFRNDDNMIRNGDLYELFYFSKNKIQSLGTQFGTRSGKLHFYNIPSNSLFLLHNHTRGREERIFTYENGEQVWW